MKHFRNNEPTVRAELAELVPVLTEMHRRQDPQRSIAADCVYWSSDDGGRCCPLIGTGVGGFIWKYRDERCPRTCDCYQPRPVP